MPKDDTGGRPRLTDRSEIIDLARARGACSAALLWMRQHPLATWDDLAAHRQEWAQWAAMYLPLTAADAEILHRLTGCRSWWLGGLRHREGGHAIEWPDGTREWWLDGLRHRDDGPAVECASGTRAWWRGGRRHRDDGPAVEYADGSREWWLGGLRHRAGGPAVERADGTREWWSEGKRHRAPRRRR
jgi:hypothetical protein